MHRILFFGLLLLLIGSNSSFAQYKTGNDDLNQTLVRIDADASIDLGAFKSQISGSYNISKSKIDYLALKVGMSAGDIFMTVEIAKILSVSIDSVVEVYQTNRGKGWGAIAKELGIKPGSAEFHALKGSAGKAKSHKGPRGKGKKG